MVTNLFIAFLAAVLTTFASYVAAELNIEDALARASAVQEQLELRQDHHALRALKEECLASDFACLLASPEILVESLTPFFELLMSNTTNVEELEGICDDWTNCDFKGSIIETNMTAECYIKGGQNVTTDIRLCDRLKDDVINWMKESELVNGFVQSEDQLNELIDVVKSVNVTEVQWTNVPLCMHKSCKPDFGLDALGPCLQTLVDQLSQDEDTLGLPPSEFTFITDMVTSIFSKEECSSSSMMMTGVAGLITLGVAFLTF
ncbi:predicted protein [Chaetoceros tenuissimus]|uniref:Uncharacterized protein n=1 Tax=Chaetoceros tenuissimus TaxID=426638 RepID=A0AAD3HAD1_9STRA|nr:predicted protein [Chaetoceros tenuissimus]